jgi:hypothetical protein
MVLTLVAKLPSKKIQLTMEAENANVVKGPAPKNEEERVMQRMMEAVPFMQGNPAFSQGPTTLIIVSPEEYEKLGRPGIGDVLKVTLERIAAPAELA